MLVFVVGQVCAIVACRLESEFRKFGGILK